MDTRELASSMASRLGRNPPVDLSFGWFCRTDIAWRRTFVSVSGWWIVMAAGVMPEGVELFRHGLAVQLFVALRDNARGLLYAVHRAAKEESNTMTLSELGWNDSFARNLADFSVPGRTPARVTREDRGLYLVFAEQGEFSAKYRANCGFIRRNPGAISGSGRLGDN